MAQIRSKQIQDFLTTVNWGSVTDKQIANASAIDARFGLAEGSIDSLESLVAAGTSDLVASVDSLEVALAAEITDRAADVDAEESRAIAAEGSLDTKVGSLNTVVTDNYNSLSTDITNAQNNAENYAFGLVSTEEIARANGDMSLETVINDNYNSLSNDISNNYDTLSGNITAEESRAMAAEAKLDASVDSLEGNVSSIDTRLGAVSGDLVNSVDSLELALSAEIAATNADFTSIDTRATGIEGNLSTEIVNRANADTSLETAIGTEKGRIDAILAGSAADLDQFAEVITYLNSVDAVNDLDLVTFMADANGNFTALDASVNSLETAVSADYNTLDGKITDAKNELGSSIDSLEGNVSSIDTRLGAVSGDLVNSVDSLELALSAEIVARGLDVDAEESRAIAAEGSLDTKVGSLNTVVSDNYNSLSTDITNAQNNAEDYAFGLVSQEILDREAGDLALDNRVDSLNTVVTNNYNDLSSDITAEESRAMAAEAVIDDSIDSLEGNISSIDTRLGAVGSSLVDSVDSLELALSAEIVDRAADVDAEESRAIAAEGSLDTKVNGKVSSIEIVLSAEIYDARLYTSDEMLRAQTEEGILAESIDSLELALAGDFSSIDARVSAEHVEHASVEAVLDGKISTEKGRIDAILLAADADKDTFAEIVSLINAVDTTNDDAFASYALATDASIDSIELALSAEIAATNDDVTAINNSIDSLETALSAEIAATNDDVAAINDSIDSLETSLADEVAARIAGDTYVEQVVTGVTSGKTFTITTPVLFGADNDLEVFVNGLKVAFTTTNGTAFTIVADYELEGTDKVTVLGIQA